jgi:NADH-quinone oxidoreductase subunit M
MDTLLFNLIWILPLITVLACAPISAQKETLLKTIHATSGTIILLLVGYLTYRLYTLGVDSAAKESAPLLLHYYMDIPWLHMFNAHYIVGADGLNMFLLFLTAVIVWAGILVSWNIKGNQKVFFALIQLLATSVYGVFMSMDLVLFFVFY